METFSQIPLEILLERADSGLACLSELQNLMKNRKLLEDATVSKFLTEMLKSNLSQYEVPGSTCEHALEALKCYHIDLSQVSSKYNEDLNRLILARLQNIYSEFEAKLTYQSQEVKETKVRYMNALENLDKAKRRFVNAKSSFEQSKSKYYATEVAAEEYVKILREKKLSKERNRMSRDRTPSSTSSESKSLFSMSRMIHISNTLGTISSAFEFNPELERDRQIEKCKSKHEEMLQCYEDMRRQKRLFTRQFNDHEMMVDKVTTSMETFQRERVQQIQECLVLYVSLERQRAEKQIQHLTHLEEAIAAIDTSADRDLCLQRYKRPEHTHKYSKALYLLDWDFLRRLSSNDGMDVNKSLRNSSISPSPRAVRSFESYVDNLTWSESALPVDLPSLPDFPPTVSSPVSTARQYSPNKFNSTNATGLKSAEMNAMNLAMVDEDFDWQLDPEEDKGEYDNVESSGSFDDVPKQAFAKSPSPKPSCNHSSDSSQSAPTSSGFNSLRPLVQFALIYDYVSGNIDDQSDSRDTIDGTGISKASTRNSNYGRQLNHSLSNASLRNSPSPSDARGDCSSEVRVCATMSTDQLGEEVSPKNKNIASNCNVIKRAGDRTGDLAVPPLSCVGRSASGSGVGAECNVTEGGHLGGDAWDSDIEHEPDMLIELLTNPTTRHAHSTEKLHVHTFSPAAQILNLPVYSTNLRKLENIMQIVFVSKIASVPNSFAVEPPTVHSQSSNDPSAHNTDLNDPLPHSVSADPPIDLDLTDPLSWHLLLSDRECRDFFLHQLDENRSSHAVLSDHSFDVLAAAMQAQLDICCNTDDVKSAMRVANMANTFHKIILDEIVNAPLDTVNDAITNDTLPPPAQLPMPMTKRMYLQQVGALRRHVIWREEGFWDACLLIGLASELDHTEPVLWDTLDADSLAEAVIGIHNILFGQLGALAFNMKEVGLEREDVHRRILCLCKAAQLSEEQEISLIGNINMLFQDSAAS